MPSSGVTSQPQKLILKITSLLYLLYSTYSTPLTLQQTHTLSSNVWYAPQTTIPQALNRESRSLVKPTHRSSRSNRTHLPEKGGQKRASKKQGSHVEMNDTLKFKSICRQISNIIDKLFRTIKFKTSNEHALKKIG